MHHFLMILHLFGLAAGLGASISGTAMSIAAARMPADEAGQVMGRTGPVLSKVGAAGLVLLIVTGVVMLIMAPGMAAAGGAWFHLKMAFVLMAVGVVGFIHMQQAKLRRGGDPAAIRPRLRLAVRGSLLAATGAMVCAVLAFH